MNPENIKKSILTEVKKQKIGASQVKITEATGLSRPTVTKYLQILKDEGQIRKIKIGRFSLWTYLANENIEEEPDPIYLDFIRYSLKSVQDEYKEIDWKQIGKGMCNYFDPSEFIRSETLREQINCLNDGKGEMLDKLSLIFEEIIHTLCSLFHLGKVQHPIIVKKPPIIIYRILVAKKIEAISIFHIISGMIEQKVLAELPGINFSLNAVFNSFEKEKKLERFVDMTLVL